MSVALLLLVPVTEPARPGAVRRTRAGPCRLAPVIHRAGGKSSEKRPCTVPELRCQPGDCWPSAACRAVAGRAGARTAATPATTTSADRASACAGVSSPVPGHPAPRPAMPHAAPPQGPYASHRPRAPSPGRPSLWPRRARRHAHLPWTLRTPRPVKTPVPLTESLVRKMSPGSKWTGRRPEGETGALSVPAAELTVPAPAGPWHGTAREMRGPRVPHRSLISSSVMSPPDRPARRTSLGKRSRNSRKLRQP